MNRYVQVSDSRYQFSENSHSYNLQTTAGRIWNLISENFMKIENRKLKILQERTP